MSARKSCSRFDIILRPQSFWPFLDTHESSAAQSIPKHFSDETVQKPRSTRPSKCQKQRCKSRFRGHPRGPSDR